MTKKTAIEALKTPQDNNVMKWAESFVEHLKVCNWSLDDIDEDLMLGWFANAMQAQEQALKANTNKQDNFSLIDCPFCDKGCVEGIEAVCCGNTNNNECCGSPVPEQTQEQCSACYGNGSMVQSNTSGWMDIESAPKDGTDIIISGGKTYNYNSGSVVLNDGWRWASYDIGDDVWRGEYSEEMPKYWFKIPTPPTEGGDNE